MYDLVISNFVKLLQYSLECIVERKSERTLIFSDSMRLGLRAPVARPKSVSLTWPVESTRKFCRGLILPIGLSNDPAYTPPALGPDECTRACAVRKQPRTFR